MQRFLALWFPDWPVQAAVRELGFAGPLVVSGCGKHRNEVWVCSVAARGAGVRRGMRVRQAQALCSGLKVVGFDQERDARLFEPALAGIDQVAAGVEVLRPGLVVVDAAAAARYHGSEEAATQLLIDASATAGVDSCAGIADELFTAVLAARYTTVVPQGGGREFLRPLPVSVLVAEQSLGCDPDTVRGLRDVGVRTLGDLAGLPYRDVVTRFGAAGKHCHDIAHARPGRRVAPPLPTETMQVSYEPDEPLVRVDESAFVARQLAITLHQRLAQAGVVCQLLRIRATMSTGEEVERTWRTNEALTEQGTADRVRWQLDGWLSVRKAGASISEEGEGVVRLVLDPVECLQPSHDAAGLWGMRGERDMAAQRAISRVQSTLGVDAVVQPRLVGGRGPAERIDFVPYGEQRPIPRDPQGSWPGRLPAPHPGRMSTDEVTLIDALGTPIIVTAQVELNNAPALLRWKQQNYVVSGWAGPWGVDERWWTPQGRRYARMQVVGRLESELQEGAARENAWLLVWSAGVWRIEGLYD